MASDLTHALELDALKNSHPIEVPVGHPSEIDEIFDAISYSKGASVIRMLHNFIGDEVCSLLLIAFVPVPVAWGCYQILFRLFVCIFSCSCRSTSARA